MAAQYSPGDRVNLTWQGERVEGTVWSYGPQDASYWVIPDREVPDMVQGCVAAGLMMMEPMTEETLW